MEFALPEDGQRDGPRAPATAVPPPSAPVSMDASGSRRQQEATTRGGKQDTINVAEEVRTKAGGRDGRRRSLRRFEHEGGECDRRDVVDVTWQMAMLRKKYDDLVTFTVRHHSL